MLEQTVRLCPYTFQYLYRMYGEHAILRVVQAKKEEDNFIRSEQGAQQEDPLGILLFCSATDVELQDTMEYMSFLQKEWKKYHKDRTGANDCDD